jgi:hypothetical protein
MRKLKLAIDNLRVESFETSKTGAERRGTVAAHMPRPPVGTAITGSCCDITLAQSCIQTNCFNECMVLTVDTCA